MTRTFCGISVMHTIMYITIHFHMSVKCSYFVLIAIVFEIINLIKLQKRDQNIVFFNKSLQANV